MADSESRDRERLQVSEWRMENNDEEIVKEK